ncbi:uncharacterized protein [Diadema antillarum]|uniref:uncharacterized protein n=1 Tax=Diadema antillarum TaxID=105358 RepID=UPI003A838553
MHLCDGSNKARQILAQQFSQPHVITHALIRKVLGRPQVGPNDGRGMADLGREMRKCQIALKMGYMADLNARDTLLKVQQLLPIHLQGKWAERAQGLIMSDMEPHFGHFTEFVEKAAEEANTMYGKNIGKKDSPRPLSQRSPQGSARRGKTAFSTQGQGGQEQQWKCQCCDGKHKLSECQQFAKKAHKEKTGIVCKSRLCDNCLRPWHFAQACRGKPAREVEGGEKKHHTLLHFTQPTNKEQSKTSPIKAGDKEPKTKKPSGTNLSTVTSTKVCL